MEENKFEISEEFKEETEERLKKNVQNGACPGSVIIDLSAPKRE